MRRQTRLRADTGLPARSVREMRSHPEKNDMSLRVGNAFDRSGFGNERCHVRSADRLVTTPELAAGFTGVFGGLGVACDALVPGLRQLEKL